MQDRRSSFGDTLRTRLGKLRKGIAKSMPGGHTKSKDTSHRLATSPPLSAAQRIPYEIVLAILEIATQDHGLANASFLYRLALGPSERRNLLAYPPPEQTFLYQLTFLCRSWSPAANHLLYNHPYLTTTSHLVFFARTLKAYQRDIPPIDTLFLVNRMSDDQSSPFDIPGAKSIAQDRDWENARDSLQLILNSASIIKTLSLNNSPWEGGMLLGMNDALSPDSSWCSHLRSLTIHKSMAPYVTGISDGDTIMSNDLFLPQLEVLCLRDVQFAENYHFPLLHRLRVLQLTQANVPIESTRTIVIHPVALPSLRTLELYSNHMLIEIDHRLFPQLTTLYLFGTSEREIVTRNATMNWHMAKRVKDFAFGPLPLYLHRANRDSFQYHRPPPSTESLTICLWLDRGALELSLLSWTFIETITHYLKKHRDQLPALKKVILRLDIFHVSSMGNTDKNLMDRLLNRVGVLSYECEALGISVDVTDEGFEGWIGTRLSGRNCTSPISLFFGGCNQATHP